LLLLWLRRWIRWGWSLLFREGDENILGIILGLTWKSLPSSLGNFWEILEEITSFTKWWHRLEELYTLTALTLRRCSCSMHWYLDLPNAMKTHLGWEVHSWHEVWQIIWNLIDSSFFNYILHNIPGYWGPKNVTN